MSAWKPIETAPASSYGIVYRAADGDGECFQVDASTEWLWLTKKLRESGRCLVMSDPSKNSTGWCKADVLWA